MGTVLGNPESSTRTTPRCKRVFDIVCSVLLIILFLPLLLATAIAVRVTSSGSIVYWSRRVGQNNRIFQMPKFRTMRVGAPEVATHFLTDPSRYLTPVGSFLRTTSLDELPQLFSVVAGDLSLVGPRPALFNQEDLVALRTLYGIDSLLPGITGWAQVNGRDELPIPTKVNFDREYLERQSFCFDLKILFMTAKKVACREGVIH